MPANFSFFPFFQVTFLYKNQGEIPETAPAQAAPNDVPGLTLLRLKDQELIFNHQNYLPYHIIP